MLEAEFMKSDRLRASELIYDGQIIQLYRNQVEIHPQVVVARELVNHQNAVVILPITDTDEIILVSQYRPAVDQVLLELPAGLIDIHQLAAEDPLIAAKRELEEETGMQSDCWEYYGKLDCSPGFCNEAMEFYIARDVKGVPHPIAGDEDEFITVKKYSRSTIQSLLDERLISDMKTHLILKLWLLGGI